MELEPAQTHKIQLTEIQKTLLVTLNAKALDSHSKNSILHDNKADEIVKMIDYDFKEFKSFGTENLLVIRAKQYDEWIKDFIKANHNALILNLGCGLDTRFTRINPDEKINWFDIDFPDVVKLRKNFYSDTNNYRMIGSTLTDPDWILNIPEDRPAMIIAEGVFEYLTEVEVKTLLSRITDRFRNSQIAFDVVSPYAIKKGQSKSDHAPSLLHKWHVNNTIEADRLNSKLERLEGFSLFKSPFMKNLPIYFRFIYFISSLNPSFRDVIRLLKYRF